LSPSFGDQGYVSGYADWLAARFDGRRPRVVNLAISGETSSSFFTGVVPPWWWGRGTLANLNYSDPGAVQFDAFLEVLQAEKAARRQVKAVSFALGANDVFALTWSPEWNAPGADQLALLEGVLAEIDANYRRFLTVARAELPQAKVLLPNYYNPYEVLGPADPTNFLYTYVVLRHDAMLQRLEEEFNKARRVDVYSAFLGHALDYTYIGFGNIHPNAAGYAVIAQAMIAASED
jgi:lysophospholipase L1-like esterase